MTGEEARIEFWQAWENAKGHPITPFQTWSGLSLDQQAVWNCIANRIDGFKGNGETKAIAPRSEFDQMADNLLNHATDKQRQLMYELLYAAGCRINRN